LVLKFYFGTPGNVKKGIVQTDSCGRGAG